MLGTLFITNFQLIFKLTPNSFEFCIPLLAIESSKKKALTPEHLQLKIKLKGTFRFIPFYVSDFRVLKFTFAEGTDYDKVSSYISHWTSVENVTEIFAFQFRFVELFECFADA